MSRQDSQNKVAVNNVAVSVDREASIRVAVVGDSDIGTLLFYLGDYIFHVRRSAAIVDVPPGRGVVNGNDFGSGAAVDSRRDF